MMKQEISDFGIIMFNFYLIIFLIILILDLLFNIGAVLAKNI